MSLPTLAGHDLAGASAPRTIRVAVRADWSSRDSRGLLSSDARVRTLRKVLATFPDVRHILPDRISLEATTDERTLEAVARFLWRQQWLVKSVAID